MCCQGRYGVETFAIVAISAGAVVCTLCIEPSSFAFCAVVAASSLLGLLCRVLIFVARADLWLVGSGTNIDKTRQSPFWERGSHESKTATSRSAGDSHRGITTSKYTDVGMTRTPGLFVRVAS